MKLHVSMLWSCFYSRTEAREAKMLNETPSTAHGNISEVSEDSITMAAELLEITHDVTEGSVENS